MHIAHIIGSLDPAAGGPPEVATRLAAAQVGLGQKVSFLTYASPGRERAISLAYEAVPNLDCCQMVALPPPDRIERIRATVARKAVQDGPLACCDVLHLHGVWDPILKAAGDAARSNGIPYIVRPAGMLDPWSLRQRRLKKRLALQLGYRRFLDGAAFVHALSSEEARLIGPLGLRSRIEIIPNGVFMEEFGAELSRGAFRKKHRELGGLPFVLFLSRLHYKKGLDYLADAFHAISDRRPDLMLVVAGPDDGEKAPFESRIAAAGLAGRVLLVGPLYGTEKLEAFADAACFCLPSRQEGFSVAILEALACGLPAVISANCHFPEVATAGAGEVVDLDPAAIGAALLRVTDDENNRRNMGLRGYELVRSRYTWPKIAKRTLAAYRTVIHDEDIFHSPNIEEPGSSAPSRG